MAQHAAPMTAVQNYVKFQKEDGSWVVAPVKQHTEPKYEQVQNPDGTISMVMINDGPQSSYRMVSIVNPTTSKKASAEKEVKKEEEKEPARLIYDSGTKSDCYFYTRWLWCACRESYHTITDKTIESHQWIGLSSVSDSHAMDIFTDVNYNQNCCQRIANSCGCCCGDMGTILLMGVADTAHPEGYRLDNIHTVSDTFSEIQKIISRNKDRLTKQQKLNKKKQKK